MLADPSRVRDLFLAAVELPSDQRPRYLTEACGDDTELRAEVDRLLAANADPDSILEPTPAATGALMPGIEGTIDRSTGMPITAAIDAASSSPQEIATEVSGPDEAVSAFAQTHLKATTAEELASPTARATRATTSEGIGIVIAGRYTLVELIGEGGMGSVYLASQSEPVRRQVALKLIRAGMDSRGVLARFDAERQALALMDHPNIARIYDGGLTPAGQPFFVMELVQGVPLAEYCDAKRLPVRDRLELFVAVCHAVQHAHQKGIIHRDLKPGNVLVAEFDGRATPKVIDFGVAKATEVKLTDISFADTGAIVGTPAYMSPEQADPSSMDIDTRTDVYALGVMLYELLVGSPPLAAGDFRRGAILEMLRMVREVDPPRPSTKLSTSEGLATIAANRRIDPARLSKLLRGELDWVVMKALEKDRDRRYDSANGFARDIQRYLADEVVEARPPSRGYRLKKFVRRNRGQVIAASLVFLALLGGIIGTSLGMAFARKAEAEEARQHAEAEVQRDKAIRAERQTALERDKAVAAEARSSTINDFLIKDLLTQAEPANNAVEDKVTLLEVLNRAAEQVGTRFKDQPVLERSIRQTIARTYHSLASWEKAADQWGAVLDVARKLDPQSAESYLALGKHAHLLRHLGWDETVRIKSVEESVRGLESTLGRDHTDTLAAIGDLAEEYQAVGRLPEAIALYERVRDTKIAQLGLEHPETLETISSLAGAYQIDGRLPEAIALFERVRDAQIARLGPNHPETMRTISGLAMAYANDGRLTEAISLLKSTRDTQIARLGPNHADTLTTLAGLAGAYSDAGRFSEAIALRKQIRDTELVRLGPENRHTLNALNCLGVAYKDAGQVTEAIAQFERARDALNDSLGPSHQLTLVTLSNLAGAYRSVGKVPEAIALLERVRDTMLASLGPDNTYTLTSLNNLGGTYLEAGRIPEAIALLERVRDAQLHRLGPDHPQILRTYSNLALAYRVVGRLPESITILERVRDARLANLGADHLETLMALGNLAVAYADAGKLAEAITSLERVRDVYRVKLGRDHPSTLKTLDQLAGAYVRVGRVPEAIAQLELARDGYIAKLGLDHPETLETLGHLVGVYRISKQLDKSSPLCEDVLKRQIVRLGRQHPDTQWSMFSLAVNYKDAGRFKEAIPLLEEVRESSIRQSKDPANRFPSLGMIDGQLIDAYGRAGEEAKLAGLLLEQLTEARKTLPKDSPQLIGLLAQFGRSLLQLKKWTEAEPILRECLAVREKAQPNAWNTFNSRSQLGGALLGQKKYDEAEQFLLKGYEGMKEREKTIPPQSSTRIPEALDRLIELASARNKPDDVKKWQAERAKYSPAPISNEKK